MQYIEQMRADLAYVEAELRNIDQGAAERALNEDEQARFNEGAEYVTAQRAAIAVEEERMRVASSLGEPGRTEPVVPNQINKRKADAYNTLERESSMSTVEFRDQALRLLDERKDVYDDGEARGVAEQRLRQLAGRKKGARAAIRHFLAHGTVEYERAYGKLMAGQPYMLTPDEQRAMSVGSNGEGGFMVPTHLDPTVILTNDGAIDPYRAISRVETLAGANVWNGITSAGVTASYATEGAEVGDDSPTVQSPSVPLHRGHAFVQFSIESSQDIGGLAGELSREFADARDRLDADKHVKGSGSDEPTGIVTALDANTNVEVSVATQGSFARTDLLGVLAAVPPRFRQNATWNMSIEAINEIRELGSNDVNMLVSMRADGIPILYGKPIAEASEFPAFAQPATTTENLLILGDFRNFLLVDKLGMFTEPVPMVFGTNGRPTGERGMYLFWRHGSDSINDLAFRLLQDGA